MNICLIVDDYLPISKKSGAKMMHDLAIELIKLGHEVTVITPNTEIKARKFITVFQGVNICYFRSGDIKNASRVKRAINESFLSYRAWRACGEYLENKQHDFIIYYSPSIFFGRLVNKLKILWGVPSYMILRDIFPQWVIDNGMLGEKSIITSYFRYFEKINYQAADTIALQSPGNLKWFKENVKTGKPLSLLYNWTSNIPSVDQKNYYRNKLNLQDKVVFFYGGNIGQAQDMMNIVRLAINLTYEKRAYFLLVGSGDQTNVIQDIIKDKGLKNIFMLPSISQDKYQLMLSEFDIGVFSLSKNHTTHNFPGKLLAYMKHEKPILGSINRGNDLIPLVRNFNAGLMSVNGDDSLLMKNALMLINDSSLRVEMGKGARQLLKEVFSVEEAAENILKHAINH